MADSADSTRPAWLSNQAGALRATFGGLTLYERFEHAIIIVLTVLIIAVVASATWHLALVLILLFTNEIRPDNQAVFQTVFGVIFTVIIALEFKHSLLMVLARQKSVVRVRSIVLIAMLAMDAPARCFWPVMALLPGAQHRQPARLPVMPPPRR